jgi:uncharacterized RmlC-like cupin family protein
MKIDVAPGCTLIRAGTGGALTGLQHQTIIEGVSARSAGARAICLHLVVIGPGEQTAAHLHAGHETALYIPAGQPHLARNPSRTEPCRVLVARTDPDEQESVVLLPELEAPPAAA